MKEMIPQGLVIEKILKAVGKPVSFKYPAGEKVRMPVNL